MDFQHDVIEASKQKPVLVDFWAPWCGPCRVLGPVLEGLEREDGRFTLVKVNTEEHPALAMEHRISSIPAVKLFANGAVAGEFVGALPAHAIKQFLDQHVPSEAGKLVAQASTLRLTDAAAAATLLERAVELDPQSSEAKLALAEALLRTEPERAMAIADGLSIAGLDPERIEGVETLAALARKRTDESLRAERGGDSYLRGIEHFSNGDDEGAIQAWLDTLRATRKLDDDGARKALVALFRWLGEHHPLSEQYRRELAKALY